MAPLEFCKTTDNEQWERLDVLRDVLSMIIASQNNGQTAITMTEQSLYSLLSAGKDDFLEITICKVKPTHPVLTQGPRPPKIPHISPWRPNSIFMDSMAPNIQDVGADKGPTARYSLPDIQKIKIRGERPKKCISLDTRIFLPLPDSVCGNCQRSGHTVRDCVGPVDERGEIDGCPKCNKGGGDHTYDDCPDRDAGEDFDLIYRYRQRKPPIRSFLVWQSFLSAAAGEEHCQPAAATWPSYIPWSARFALERQDQALRARRPPEWVYYDYDRAGWPDVEAHYREIDPDSEFIVL
ncbi:hypothetical protein E8E14_004134 [Neopestalotiopsis sp. 37M]|nr:hypothetical protein E8E14_004134 [Neopestalotiopsis sp. 37M]